MYRPLIAMAVLCIAVGAAALLLFAARADWVEWNGVQYERIDTRVNAHTASAQNRVALDVDESGVATVVWESRRQQRGHSGVYLRRVGVAGVPSSPEIALADSLRLGQRDPAVGVASNAAIAWAADGSDGAGDDVWLRTSPLAPPVRVTASPASGAPALARLGDGGTVVAWARRGEGGGTALMFRRFDADGVPTGPAYEHPRPFGDDGSPALATVPEGGFALAWTRTVEGMGSVLLRVFDAEGRPRAPPTTLSRPTHVAIEPSVAAARDGSLLVAWMDRAPEDPDYDVYVAHGSPAGPFMSRPLRTRSAHWESGVAVAADPAGGFVVAWNEADDATRDGAILARRVGASGEPAGEVLSLSDGTSGTRALAAASGARRVVFASDGRLLVAWSGDSGNGDASAAMLTQLRPMTGGVLARAASTLRERLRGWAMKKPPQEETAAAPHQPPTRTSNRPPPDRDTAVRRGAGTLGFTGFFDSSWNPPDPSLAVGPDHLMLIGNGTIVARETDGTLLWENAIDDATGFWGSVGATDLVFDPEVLYDHTAGRFFAMACEQDEALSYVLLAVSATGDPTGAWHKYRLDVTPLGGADIDSPNLAVDDDVIYVTADFFAPDRVLLLTIDKTSVLAGGVPDVKHVFATGTHSFGLPLVYGEADSIAYMVESFESEPETSVRLWAIRDPLTGPWLESVILTVPTYYQPPLVPSQGTSVRIQTFGGRFWSAAVRDSVLWACHHIAESGDSTRRSVARWYAFDMHGWPTSGLLPALAQSGTVDPGAPVHLSFAAIAPDAEGNAVLVYTRSAVDEYFSMSRSARFAADPPGTMSAGPDTIKASPVPYTSIRWGDYAAVVPDPVQPGTFWMAGEYSPSTGFWEVWVEREDLFVTVDVPGAATVAAASPFAYPSPSTGPTTFRVDNPESQPLQADVFGIDGRLVRRLDWGVRPAGVQRLPWDGRTEFGRAAASGRYVVRVTSGSHVVATGTITILH